MEKIEKIVANQYENHLFPFFWQHGETKEVLERYMDKIAGCGMKAACIEARPHPDFVGSRWWQDLGIIIDKAKQHDMKIWILDDAHFPTGYANGMIKKDYPHLKKWYLDMRRFDVAGPVCNGKINMTILKGRPWEKSAIVEEEPIIGIYAAQRSSNRTEKKDSIDVETMIDITKCYDEEILTWDIPKGNWSVFVLFMTRKRGEDATEDYLNPLVKEATEVLIEAVYEPHFDNLKEEFGKTIVGFFSDEPRFGNVKGTEASIGRVEMVVPWRDGLEKELGFEERFLPLLFIPANGKEAEVRLKYMDTITKLYNKNFTKVLADWCHAHGVCYLGHTIEDNGAHARLGYGTGHYFRGQEAQDYSGIDVIGGQIVPGMPYHHDAFSTGGSNGEFYHYALAKLGSSAAHLDAKKQGRAMCEAFGAYGWNEGLKMMKWISDHLIVRGINYLVPHAFNPKEYPDWDCPPHFYAHGHNPQFRYFHVFSNYANRLLDLFSDGIHRAPVAVLYPAENEWAGDYLPVEKPVRELAEVQIDCDIVSMDYLRNASIQDKNIIIEQEHFSVLVIPYGEYLPDDIVKKIIEVSRQGVKVIFVGGFPKASIPSSPSLLEELKDCCVAVTLEDLAKECEEFREIELEISTRDCVYYHYEHKNMHCFMLFNENISDTLVGKVRLPMANYYYEYDAFSNRMFESKLDLQLAPYESKVLLASDKKLDTSQKLDITSMTAQNLDLTWKVSFADAKEYPDFHYLLDVQTLEDLRMLPDLEKKTGTVKYEAEYPYVEQEKQVVLELEQAWEIAEVFVNGVSTGIRICGPYRFDLTGLLSEQSNTVSIEVTNTLGNCHRDGLSQYLVIEPFGITGTIRIYI